MLFSTWCTVQLIQLRLVQCAYTNRYTCIVITSLTVLLQHDADMLEATMAGAGTKDAALVRRIVMIHWSRDRMNQCKAAYKHFYKRDLADRIKGETSGDLERLLVAIVSA